MSRVLRRIKIMQDALARKLQTLKLALPIQFFLRKRSGRSFAPSFGVFHLGLDRLTFPTSRHG